MKHIQAEHPEIIQAKLLKEAHAERGWIFQEDFPADHWNPLNLPQKQNILFLKIFPETVFLKLIYLES
jgi:hypothetical protein